MSTKRDIDGLDHQRLENVVTSDRFMSLSVEMDESHRIELRATGGRRYVIENRSLRSAVEAAHAFIIEQDFEDM